MAEKSLQPVEQKEVEMYGDTVTAVRLPDGHVYVSVRHMSDALGLAPAPQTRRIKRNEVLAEGFSWVTIMVTQQRRSAWFLRADLVPLWLTGISTNAVKEEIAPKLKQLQVNAARILWEAFQAGELDFNHDFAEILAGASGEAKEAYLIAQAVFKLAKHQLVLESRLNAHEDRLSELEDQLALPTAVVTPDEAMQISQAVKAVSIVLGKQSGRNEFGSTYGELYRKFGVSSYKQIPRSKFQEVIAWLSEWYTTISDENLPF